MSATALKPAPESQPQRMGSPRRATDDARATRIVVVLLALAFLANVAWRLWLVRNVQFLSVRVDEDGYLIAARAIDGGPGGYTSENLLFRRIGYPLLISPVYWFVSEPAAVYKGVQILNAIINSFAVVLAYLCARCIFDLTRVMALAVSVAVAVIPSVVFYGEFAMTDAVLVPFLLAWVLALHAMLGAAGRRQSVLGLVWGLLGGALLLIHIRGTVIVGVQILLMLAMALRHRSFRLPALASGVGVALSLVVDVAVRIAIRDDIIMIGDSPAGTLVQRLFTPNGVVHTLNWALGQLWYLTVSTLGLTAVGMWAAARWLRHGQPERRARTITLGVLLAVTAGIAIFSAATLPDSPRINMYAYPRYLAFLAPMWIVVAIAALIEEVNTDTQRAWRRALRFLAPPALLIGVGAYAILSYSGRLTVYNVIPFDAPEVGALTAIWDRLPVVRASVLALVGLLALVILLTARHRAAPFLALGMVFVLSVTAMPSISYHAAAPMSARFAPGLLLAEAGVAPGDRVAEADDVLWWVRANHQWEVTWDRVVQFDSTESLPPAAATVVIAPWRAPVAGDPSDAARQCLPEAAGSARPVAVQSESDTQPWALAIECLRSVANLAQAEEARGAPWDGTALGWRMVAVDAQQGWAVWRR